MHRKVYSSNNATMLIGIVKIIKSLYNLIFPLFKRSISITDQWDVGRLTNSQFILSSFSI